MNTETLIPFETMDHSSFTAPPIQDLEETQFQDSDSVAANNGSDQSLDGDYMCLVPLSSIPTEEEEPLIDHKPDEFKDSQEVNRFGHDCSCNLNYDPFDLFEVTWPGRCGPCCQYRYPHPRDRWRCGPNDQETVPTGVGAGLRNLGNTCYVNAILQCLTHTVPLVMAIRSSNHPNPCHSSSEGFFCIVCTLRDHIESSLASSGKAISPYRVVNNLRHILSRFEEYQQEDAHEFLQCLLDKLRNCCPDTVLSDEDNIVERVFGGRSISKLRCCKCGHISNNYEPLLDMSLEIEGVGTLQSALESYTKVEKMEDDVKFICDHCKEEASREKQLMLDQAPSVAAFMLKRFKTDGSSIEKIDKHVEFPLEIDLKPYANISQGCDEIQVDLNYLLSAIVVHIGVSANSGHYFCYVRSSPSTWHKLDDSRVVKVEEEEVLSQAAYLLFYVREGTPWISSLADSFFSFTSPRSVLDRAVTESAAYPHSENLDHCESRVSRGDIESTSNHFSCVTVAEKDWTDKTWNDTEGVSAENCNGSRQSEPKLYSDESKKDTSMNDVSMWLDTILPPVQENRAAQDSDRIGRSDGHRDRDPPTLLTRSSPLSSCGGQSESRHNSRRDHMKVEHSVDFKKPKKGVRDQKAEAYKYINNHMSNARRMKFLAAISPVNEKKTRIRSLPCKQTSPPRSRSEIPRRSAVLR
ncbi:ubiquitin carboxyl-terminal hydrolase 21 [Mercurialis annua]|uniref:ubiquitin carboxyl-terminal hydrolase 21 n=1 Tax=Mercurialis annua TaxID=3986 RepID=UPI002160E7F6|nr:ubiquitin carboxyl-terminal hydrolase 21 [Mercurialis annua]